MPIEFPWDFEHEPWSASSLYPRDEASINLRGYLDKMPDDKLRQYSAAWSDEHLATWDGNFRDDGALFLVCSERDVDIEEYRQVLEECIRYRARVRPGEDRVTPA